MGFKLFANHGQRVLLVHGSTIVILNAVIAHKKMLDSSLLGSIRSSCSYGYLPKYLTGVSIDDWDMKKLSHTEAQFSFAYARRAEYYN